MILAHELVCKVGLARESMLRVHIKRRLFVQPYLGLGTLYIDDFRVKARVK